MILGRWRGLEIGAGSGSAGGIRCRTATFPLAGGGIWPPAIGPQGRVYAMAAFSAATYTTTRSARAPFVPPFLGAGEDLSGDRRCQSGGSEDEFGLPRCSRDQEPPRLLWPRLGRNDGAPLSSRRKRGEPSARPDPLRRGISPVLASTESSGRSRESRTRRCPCMPAGPRRSLTRQRIQHVRDMPPDLHGRSQRPPR